MFIASKLARIQRQISVRHISFKPLMINKGSLKFENVDKFEKYHHMFSNSNSNENLKLIQLYSFDKRDHDQFKWIMDFTYGL